jgi:hypothetical protein
MAAVAIAFTDDENEDEDFGQDSQNDEDIAGENMDYGVY